MTFIDNMGGFISAKFILHSEVDSMTFFSEENECTLSFYSPCNWCNLKHKTNGINIQVSTESPNAGVIYNISGSVILKKESFGLPILRIRHNILLAAENTDGKTRLFGTDEYPLKSTLTPLLPGEPGGFSGYKLDFTGSQLVEPPFLKQ